ncbi:hypothetical protein CEE56_05865 [Stenotrophomonas maltophilia]|nr:hypothetical protein CEE56_05865 [Stenotrophomonas maltophilia]
MDAAAKPPRMGLRRPSQPDPPRHSTDRRLLLLLWLLRLRLPASGRHYPRVQGAALPNTPSCCAAECIRLNLHALLESI